MKGGWDFVGDEYDADGTDHASPKPDANPLDCNGHGSHVAGTAGGGGVNADGDHLRRPVQRPQTPSTTSRSAPASLRRSTCTRSSVFGCEGSTDVTAEAIDWAVAHDMDVINMSLGSPFGTAGDPSAVAAQNAARAGVVVVTSSGNSGPSPYITGSPGTGAGWSVSPRLTRRPPSPAQPSASPADHAGHQRQWRDPAGRSRTRSCT